MTAHRDGAVSLPHIVAYYTLTESYKHEKQKSLKTSDYLHNNYAYLHHNIIFY